MSLQQVAEGQANPEVVINRNSQTLEHQAVYGQRQSAHSGLTWGYYGGRWGGFSVADGTLTLTDAATNYVVVEIATGTISTSTSNTNWNNDTDYARVYRIVTASGVVTNNGSSDFDYRAGPGGVHGGSGGGGGGGTVDLTTDVTGVLPVANGGSGVSSLTAYAPIFGGTTSTGPVQSGSVGTAGQVLTSNGAGALPTFQSAAGGGDASTNTATSVDNEIALFSGTGGKTLKRATTTGVLKAASGVIAAAAAGTDYYAPGSTDVAVADGGTGVSSLTAYAVICGGTTSTGAVQSIAGVGTSGQVLTSNGAGALPTFQTPAGGSLTNWTEAVNTSAPNATVPVTSFTATNAASNVDAALVAKGTGASLAHIPNNAAGGGNKRGNYATDWQKARAAAAQVASGANSTISGGENNTASAAHTTVSGGVSNTASAARASVGGGTTNDAAASDCVINGGDGNSITSGGTWGVIGGGRSNILTASDAVVLGGRSNQSGGQYSSTSGFTAVVSAEGGQAHGRNITIDGQYSHGRGRRFNAQGMVGVDGWASGSFSDGSGTISQRYRMLLRTRTTDATTTSATSDGAAVSGVNQPALTNSLGASAIFVHGKVIASGTANNTTDVKSWEFKATLRRGTSGNVALVNAVTPTVVDAGSTAGAWTVAVTADTGNQCLSVQVTGEAAKTINWAADLEVVHCSA